VGLPTFSAYAPSRLVARRPVAIDQVEIEVAAPEGALARFERPGQFCRVRVADAAGAAQEGIFAMFSAPHEGALRFLLRTPSPEGGEAADALGAMPVGSAVEITMPAGEGFPLERALERDVHFVATGTAIAPARAAIEAVLRARHRYGRLSLDHGLRSPAHLAIAGDAERWRTSAGMEVRLHYSVPAPDGTLRGVRAQDAVAEHVRDWSRAAFVAVGQPEMVEELRAIVAARGGDPTLVLHNY
jgi:ferredoxin-NADP reductase